MKVATFNINNINRRLPNLLRWLKAAKPDAVALQELKASEAEFPLPAIEKAGYGAVWRGQKTWNGVAILARKAEPILIRDRRPRDAGLRLDHVLLSPALAPRLLKAGVDKKIRGEEGASDHAPAWVVLK